MEQVIGYVSRLGYLYCARCAAERDLEGSPVYERSAPHNAESCDACQTPLVQPQPVWGIV